MDSGKLTPQNIRRVDYPARYTYGWLVQVEIKGERHRKFFSDNVYGSRGAALKQAVAYRDTLKQRHDARYARWRRNRLRQNNTSGIPGVGRYESATGGPYWMAFWDDHTGKRRAKKFSVGGHGEAGARRKAIQARRYALQQLFDTRAGRAR